MACINMFNPDHQGLYGGGGGGAAPPPMSPRISFSNDFVLDAATGCPTVKYERSSPAAAAPSASDFEFSVGSYGMIQTADELFFKGRLLPLKEHCAATQMQRMTLRDELLASGDDDDDDLTFSPSSSARLPGKVSHRWKTLLGLRKPHSVGKKHDKKQEKQLQQQQEDGEDGEEEEVVSHVTSDDASCQQDPSDDGRGSEIGL